MGFRRSTLDTSPDVRRGVAQLAKGRPTRGYVWMLAASFVLMLLPTASVMAQEEPAASFDDLAEVKEVLLDVLAVDRSGHTVVGLVADDFIIEENGQEVEITGVSFYTTRYDADKVADGPAGTLGDDVKEELENVVPSSRYFILFFHNPIGGGAIGNLSSRQQIRVRRDTLEWVEEHMLPSDWVAVVGYDVRLKVYQDFTQDRFTIGEGIQNASLRKDPEKGLGRGGRALPPSGAPSLLRHLPKGKALRKASRNLYDALKQLAEATGYVVGRKNLVMFSTGFDELDSINLVSEPDRRRYPPMLHALNDHNVAVYTVDLTPAEIRRFEGGKLTRLSLDTGGYYFRDPISFTTPLQRISEENVGYYLISYQSDHPANDDGYQEVKVRARNKAIKLRARKGYRFGRE